MKTTETACLSDELCRLKEEEEEEEEEEEGEFRRSRIKRVLDRLTTLSIPTVRVEALKYSQLH